MYEKALFCIMLLSSFAVSSDAKEKENCDTTCSDSSTNWVAIGVGCAGGAILAPFVVSALGFTAAGVAAGSLAAVAQSAMGNVAAGSAFAVMQGLAAGGATGTLAAGGAAIGASFGYLIGHYIELPKAENV